jgi:hypothetical protein
VDPFTAIAALRAAYSGIQYCCQALGEGKVEVQRIKKAVEDAKTIAKDVGGIWSTIKSLFKFTKSEDKFTKQVSDINVVNTPKSTKDEYIDHIPDEDEIVQQFVKHLGVFFKNHHDLVEYTEKRYQEVFTSANPDQTQILERLFKVKRDYACKGPCSTWPYLV